MGGYSASGNSAIRHGQAGPDLETTSDADLIQNVRDGHAGFL